MATVLLDHESEASADGIAAAHGRKWVAVWVSLLVPGLGLLCARRISGVVWLVIAVAIAAQPWIPCRSGFIALCAVISAELARRAWEPKPVWTPAGRVVKRMFYRPPRGRSVSLGFELEIPLAASEVWRRIARAQEFLCLDPFHCRVVLLSPRLTAGAELRIDHLIMGISIARFGRILYWNEEEGYALSDLSGRGKRRGFPHVFFIRVTPMGQQGCRLTVEVRGRWTTPFVPARIGMYWLRWVASDHARLLQKTI